ncbi:hypothetical protein AVEN_105734-1 [Araneus ventricosus]|uniref:Uncharacterized protein n=1 Tax=Araneus ventricosus TaxID=182803 RepID=A0A4Y2IDK1_ARAVE|nr:hypothetical protein AVEN_105734-1 [Araneus ventricosus]
MQFTLLLAIREERLKKPTKRKESELLTYLSGRIPLLCFGSAVSSAGSHRDRVVKEAGKFRRAEKTGQIIGNSAGSLCLIRCPFSAWDWPSPPLVRVGTGWSRKPGRFVVRKKKQVRSFAAPLDPHSGIMGRSPHPRRSLFLWALAQSSSTRW